jgi:KUP system potassium uptake protein
MSQQETTAATGHKEGKAGLALAAIGVVFGDIGTSPLYTMKEVFHGAHGIAPLHDNVLGALSLVLWSLLIVVSLKYVVFIMRADNRGEGGIMALLALTLKSSPGDTRTRWLLMTMGLFGAALFYGDGVITPAISVLSAVEGLQIATPALKPFVIPITLVVLVALFLIQRRGTASVGALFGPVMVIWFITLALLGIVNILHEPAVLQAVNPLYGVHFFQAHSGMHSWRWARWFWRLRAARRFTPTWGTLVACPSALPGFFWFCLPSCSIILGKVRS